MFLGCIADDLTGATDLSLTLSREGLRTLQCSGTPRGPLDASAYGAIVIALKSRNLAARQAVEQSLEACDWLRANGARRLLFKYCSTFDSTDDGNIGPVADALLDRLGADFTLACPAFPAAGRSVYMGHLFVNGVPLAESPMRDHPLTPMRDSDLRRVLQRQTPHPVGGVGYADVDAGADAIRLAFARERAAGRRHVVVDALNDRHLREIGAAAADLALVTGGSGVALGLPAAYHARGWLEALHPTPERLEAPAGRRAILAGSCSAMTRRQIEAARAQGLRLLQLDPTALAEGRFDVEAALSFARQGPDDQIPLIYSSDDPEGVAKVQARWGREAAGGMIEAALARIAKGLVAHGFRRLVVAGGETSGAVVQALGVERLEIGPEIDPGVPWTLSQPGGLALALKSGNFGAEDFFLKAWELLS